MSSSSGSTPTAGATKTSPQEPQAKAGGAWAGIAAVIREIGRVISASGGVIVVLVAVSAVLTITTATIGQVADGERGTVVAAAFSVLGTIIGAYFGVRVGAHGKDQLEEDKQRAEDDRKVANAKVERLAAKMGDDAATPILDEVDERMARP